MTEVKTAICRFCHAFCGLNVTLDGDRPVKVLGDIQNPMYHGYSCIKGRQLPDQYLHHERLLRPQRKAQQGHESIASAAALNEIAARLKSILDEHGPRSVALYTGTYSFPYPAGGAMARAFMQALGSPMTFTSGSIDQPGKPMALAFHGRWHAGPQPFSESDTWMLVGANPVVSKWGGIPQYNPGKRLHEALARGMKLIVIDPQQTREVAQADLWLRPLPGRDLALGLSLLKLVIAHG
jgi:anaerobic selenocysteine-containing dehydrogenase